ncbi:MAG: hypothetical protein WC449_06030 [Candidatus Paceibacterota bacterium]
MKSSDKEIICTLHSQHSCEHIRSYSRTCELNTNHKYVSTNCKYRLEAVVLSAAGQGESPENVVQQTNGAKPSEIAADTMDIKDVF